MIDKKLFRVTNEQAKNLATCKNPSCTGCASHGLCEMATNGNWEKPVEILSLDLLDARKLIDKQESLIKEMRAFISRIGIYQLDDIDIEERRSILEKTKDYTECPLCNGQGGNGFSGVRAGKCPRCGK